MRTLKLQNYQVPSDGQIQISIWFNHDFNVEDSIWNIVIRFVIRFKKFAIWFEFCADHKSFVVAYLLCCISKSNLASWFKSFQ